MNYNKIVSVVVTYNRKNWLLKNIKALLNQSRKLDEIIIVDNASTDGTYEFVKELVEANECIKYYTLPENTGGSGGFSWGVQKAYELGADYIWGMDDDAIPMADALECLAEVAYKMNKPVALWSNCDKSSFEEEIKEVDTWMFVGFFLSREIIKKIGFPRNDYFIYWDDHEYALRIRKAGYRIYKVRDSVINHQDAVKNYYPEIRFGSIHMNMFKMADWRVYYYVRNQILTYKWNDIKKYEIVIIETVKMLIKAIVFKTGQGKIVLKGFKDGVMNRAGKRMSP